MKNIARLLGIFLGVLIMLSGIWCVLNPGLTFLEIGWVAGLCMLLDGISNIFTWVDLRKAGIGSKWILVLALISVCFGVVLLISAAMQEAFDLFIVYSMACWLVLGGAIRIISGLGARKINDPLFAETLGRRWWLGALIGALAVAFGVFSFLHPYLLAISLGMLIGIGVTMAGISLAATSASTPMQ